MAAELSDTGTAIREWVPGFLVFQGIVRLVLAAVLVTAAVLLMRRRMPGRWVAAGAGFAIVASQFVEYGVRSGVSPASGTNSLSTVSSVVLPVVLVIVALNASTRRWLAHRRPQPWAPPPQPWAPPPQPWAPPPPP